MGAWIWSTACLVVSIVHLVTLRDGNVGVRWCWTDVLPPWRDNTHIGEWQP